MRRRSAVPGSALFVASASAVALSSPAASLADAPRAEVTALKRCAVPSVLAGHFRRLRARDTSCREARRVLRDRRCGDSRCSLFVARGRAGVYRCTLRPNDNEGADAYCRGPGTRRVSWSSFS